MLIALGYKMLAEVALYASRIPQSQETSYLDHIALRERIVSKRIPKGLGRNPIQARRTCIAGNQALHSARRQSLSLTADKERIDPRCGNAHSQVAAQHCAAFGAKC